MLEDWSRSLHRTDGIIMINNTRNHSLSVLLSICLCCASVVMAALELKQDDVSGQVVLCNEIVSIAFNPSNGTYAITDKTTGQLMIDKAGISADSRGNADGMRLTWTQDDAKDSLGAGRRLVVAMEHTKPRAVPVYLFTFTVYEGRGAVAMGFGMRNTMKHGARLMRSSPLAHGRLLSGVMLETPQTLNGAAGSDRPSVETGANRSCPNSLLLTGTTGGKRRSFVWGGLANREFGKWVELRDGKIEMRAEDPVGRLVDPGTTYISEDTFYLDVTQPDPFIALETYGLATMPFGNSALV